MEILIRQPPRNCPFVPVEDELPGAKNFALEQEEGWFGSTTCTESLTWTPAPFSDDETGKPPASLGLDQEEGWTAQVEGEPWNAVPFSYDETSAGLKNFALDHHEGWTAQIQVQSWSAVVIADEAAVTVPSPFGLDSDGVPPGVALAQNWYSPRLSGDEEAGTALKNFALLHDEPWVAQVQSLPWIPRPASDDETSAGLANFGLDQEEPDQWLPSSETVSWIARSFTEDDPGASLANFGLDQEDAWTAQVQAGPWTAVLFVDGQAITPFVVVPTVGGSVARTLPSWSRTAPRTTWQRSVERTLPSWNRIIRYDPMANPITRHTLQAHASDDRLYLFDMTSCPELVAGDTIASATITGDTAGLTIGTPAATTVELDGIAAGFAAQCTISGFVADTNYNLSAIVTLASGRKVVVPGRWVVMADS